MRFYQIKEGSVEDLEKDLKDTEATSYDAIDRLMKAIAKEYNITPKKLHDLFVEKHGVIPDDWIKDKLEEAWSQKYKRSINCKNPKGFSQRAHCQGRKKKVKENFADGRNPQDKGDSKRYGVPTKGSISSLRKIAKQGGRKGQLAHWLANMKSGKRKKKTNESNEQEFNLIDMLEIALPIAMKELGLEKLPKIHLVNQVKDIEQPTFGQYKNQNEVIYLGIKNRHPLDIIRTLVHELTHHKQNLQGHLGPNSGDTGSPEENEAHAKAGIIMRHLNKMHPEFFKAEPIHLS